LYGDCKDKAYLLKVFLELMGIESDPVLISTRFGKSLLKMKPNMHIFDHVILKVKIGDQAYFVDPTHSFQAGSLSERYHGNYEYGLVIAPKEKYLSDIPPSPQPKTIVTTKIELKEENQAQIAVETRFENKDADDFRAYYDKITVEQFKEDLLNFSSTLFEPTAFVSEPEVNDYPVINTIIIREKYFVLNFYELDKETLEKKISVGPVNMRDYLMRKFDRKNKSSTFHPHPLYIEEHIEIAYENKDWENEYFSEEIKDEAFRYKVDYYATPQALHYDYIYESLMDHIPYQNLEQHKNLLKKAQENSCFALKIPSELPPRFDMQTSIFSGAFLIPLFFFSVKFITRKLQ
jgi:hypothetical protein